MTASLPCLLAETHFGVQARPLARNDNEKGIKMGERGRVRDDFCCKLCFVEVSIPYEVDKGFGVFVSGDDPSIGQD